MIGLIGCLTRGSELGLRPAYLSLGVKEKTQRTLRLAKESKARKVVGVLKPLSGGIETIVTNAHEAKAEVHSALARLSSEIGPTSVGESGTRGPISPPAGEMSSEMTEGGGAANSVYEECGETPPSVLPDCRGRAAGLGPLFEPPTRGEIGPEQASLPVIPPFSDGGGQSNDEPVADPFHGFHIGHGRDWFLNGRDEQKPPEGDWRTWLIMGGRGSGKTRAGAEWVHAVASAGVRSDLRIALVAETLGDAREVMIDGVSGICRVARKSFPAFEISRRRLVWPNGAVAQIFSSEDPEALRGPQFHYAWCDEQTSALCARASIFQETNLDSRNRHFTQMSARSNIQLEIFLKLQLCKQELSECSFGFGVRSTALSSIRCFRAFRNGAQNAQ